MFSSLRRIAHPDQVRQSRPREFSSHDEGVIEAFLLHNPSRTAVVDAHREGEAADPHTTVFRLAPSGNLVKQTYHGFPRGCDCESGTTADGVFICAGRSCA